MKARHLTPLILFFVLWLSSCLNHQSGDVNSKGKTSMEKINSSGKIRCSYLLYSPYFMKDPNSGQLSGIFYELMMEIGKNSDLTIEWVEEVGYENIFTGLEANRYDVFAGGLWPNASRAKAGSFSEPAFYSVITAWVRQNESEITDLSQLSSGKYKIATIDGAMEDLIAKTDYPNAPIVSLTTLSPFTQNLLNITSNKADITFAEPGVIFDFLKTNPNSLKQLNPEKPLRIFGNSLVVKKGEFELVEFLDWAIKEVVYSGKMDTILTKYETGPNSFPRVIKPYAIN